MFLHLTRNQSISELLSQQPWIRKPLIQMEQIHGAEIGVVTRAQSHIIPGVDALITDLPKTILAVRTADCLPILIWHRSGTIAAIHAGRKGTQLEITKKVCLKLQADFDCDDNLDISFGPCICKNCYQINKDTDQHFDLVAENKKQIAEIFPKSAQKIKISEFCTAHHNQNYFSYRVEKTANRQYSLVFHK